MGWGNITRYSPTSSYWLGNDWNMHAGLLQGVVLFYQPGSMREVVPGSMREIVPRADDRIGGYYGLLVWGTSPFV